MKNLITFWIIFYVICVNATEKDLLNNYSKIFNRNNGKLVIQIDSNKSKKEFIDDLKNGKDYLKTTLEEYYKDLNLVLIHQQYHEGDAFKLISLSSGDELRIPVAPTWSPDSQFFAVANDDESDYTENIFLIGKCDRSACKKLLERKGRSGGLKWKDNKTVIVEMRTYNGSSGNLETSKLLECHISGGSASCPD